MSCCNMSVSSGDFAMQKAVPSHAAALNECTQPVEVLTRRHDPYARQPTALFFPKDGKTQLPHYLARDEPVPAVPGELFEGVTCYKVSQAVSMMSLDRMPGFKVSYTIPEAVDIRRNLLAKVPRHVPKEQKIQWLSTKAGYEVVKMAAGQIPFHYSDEQFAVAVKQVTGCDVVSVESMMHTTGKGRNGFRFIFVNARDVDHILRTMNRLCLFKTNEVCVFNYEAVGSPLHWCKALMKNVDPAIATKPLLPMTLCVASQQ